MNLQKTEMCYLQAYCYLSCTVTKKWSSHAPICSFPLSTTTIGATNPLCTGSNQNSCMTGCHCCTVSNQQLCSKDRPPDFWNFCCLTITCKTTNHHKTGHLVSSFPASTTLAICSKPSWESTSWPSAVGLLLQFWSQNRACQRGRSMVFIQQKYGSMFWDSFQSIW